jgi:diguanylate cyclase (GGDEF)-like protein
MGGDEFAILCARVSTEEEMKQIAAKLIKVCGEPIQLENGELVHVGASIGALIINKACSMDEIYAKADEALYESKNSGKNCCKIRTL